MPRKHGKRKRERNLKSNGGCEVSDSKWQLWICPKADTCVQYPRSCAHIIPHGKLTEIRYGTVLSCDDKKYEGCPPCIPVEPKPEVCPYCNKPIEFDSSKMYDGHTKQTYHIDCWKKKYEPKPTDKEQNEIVCNYLRESICKVCKGCDEAMCEHLLESEKKIHRIIKSSKTNP